MTAQRAHEAHGSLSAAAREQGTSPQAIQQRQRAAKGLCAQCATKRGKGLSWYCRSCQDAYGAWRVEWLAARREQGLCRCGGALGDNTSRCSTCLSREETARRARKKLTRR